MERQNRKGKKVEKLKMIKTNSDNNEVPVSYHIWDYGSLRKKRNQIPIPVILSFSSGDAVHDENPDYTQRDLLRVKGFNRDSQCSSADELAERCAQLPPGVGEEEYLAELDKIQGDNLGEAS